MRTPTNPLLLAIRTSPNFKGIPCIRTYTTLYENGRCRVEFYCVLSKNHGEMLEEVVALTRRLRRLGWTDITRKFDAGYGNFRPSLTLLATPKE
jgi:hypothetical protein